MKIGVISDIHGNIRALNPCLDFLRGERTDRIIFLGDAIGYMPFGVEVLSRLKAEGIECVKGNHEAMLTGMLPIKEQNKDIYKLSEQKNKLSAELINFIQSWDESICTEADGRKYFFVHGSPDDHLNGYVYPDSDLSLFKNTEWDVVVMGHTHYPFLREEYGKVFVNPGSVGLPRDTGNISSFAVIETAPFTVKHYRMEFDVDQVLREMKKEDIHVATAERLRKNNGKELFGELIIN
jgi:putative phosphoesterase